jgi:membrane protease YdiL (CAAX protease family)
MDGSIALLLPRSLESKLAAREYAAGIARIIIGLITILAMRRPKWGSYVLSWRAPRGWAIILPVAAYSLVVYPLIFTGTLGLNLSQPNVAAGVAFNGFAAGALEELVFRGLILSLLLGGNLDDQSPSNVRRAYYFCALI